MKKLINSTSVFFSHVRGNNMTVAEGWAFYFIIFLIVATMTATCTYLGDAIDKF